MFYNNFPWTILTEGRNLKLSIFFFSLLFAGLILGQDESERQATSAVYRTLNNTYDWPNWRGPNYDGSSAEKGLLRQWPKEGPKIIWKAPILRGWCCPSVSGDEVFVFGSELHGGGNPDLKSKDCPDNGKWVQGEKNNEILQCLDTKSGKEKWRYVYQ